MASNVPGSLFLSIWQIPLPLLFGCGTVATLAMSVGLSDIPTVTAAEAAEMLGVSTARVARLCRDGSLNSWRVGGIRMVSRDSIECRLAAKPEAGRLHGASAEGKRGLRADADLARSAERCMMGFESTGGTSSGDASGNPPVVSPSRFKSNKEILTTLAEDGFLDAGTLEALYVLSHVSCQRPLPYIKVFDFLPAWEQRIVTMVHNLLMFGRRMQSMLMKCTGIFEA